MSRSDQPQSINADDLPLSITREDPRPGYLQLADQLHALIASRTLRAGTKLPATRALASRLGINRNSIVAAFERLVGLGLIETHGRGGSVVSGLPKLITPEAAAEARSNSQERTNGRAAVRPRTIDFRLGSADPSPLPIAIWRRACREAGRHLPGADYGDPRGDVELRKQIARYLGRTRAMRVDPEQVIVTTGAGQAIERIAEAILRPKDYAAFEEPGYPRAARTFRQCGARLAPAPVDDDGIVTESLFARKPAPKLIHLTPSHQYPMGARLSTAKRHLLIRWAREKGVLIVENDYDGEFRYGSAPLPTLAAMAGFEQVAYVGTFSKVLSPAIRLGLIVARPNLIEAISKNIAEARESVSVVTQCIVTWLIKSGELERHIRRARRNYSARRAAILGALADISQVESVSGHAAGLHVVVKMREERSYQGLSARLERQGVHVDRVADFQLGMRTDKRLLMAYGHLTEPEILEGIRRLGTAMRRS